jgi:hypothetical protein
VGCAGVSLFAGAAWSSPKGGLNARSDARSQWVMNIVPNTIRMIA